MIINGKEVANAIKASLAEKVAGLKQQYGRSPKLAVILVGDDPASAKYVHNKELACERVGIENITLRMPADSTEEQVLAEVAAFNADPLNEAFGQLFLAVHVDQLIFQGGGTRVHNQNFHL